MASDHLVPLALVAEPAAMFTERPYSNPNLHGSHSHPVPVDVDCQRRLISLKAVPPAGWYNRRSEGQCPIG